MTLFRSSKKDKAGESKKKVTKYDIPHSARKLKARKNTVTRNKFSQRVAQNNPLQIFILFISTVMLFLYIGMSALTVSQLYYTAVKNTEAYQAEERVIGVESYEINFNGGISFKTIEGLEYPSDTGATFVMITSGVIPEDTIWYVPSENVLVDDLSVDFVQNFLSGNRYWFVLAYAFILDMFRVFMKRLDSDIMQNGWVAAICHSMWILMLLLGAFTYLLLC